MKDKLEALIKQKFINLKKYTPIQPAHLLAEKLGINLKSIIKLDANENTFGLHEEIQAQLAQFNLFHQYPDPDQYHLREEIADFINVSASNIVVGTGADEILDLLFRLFLEKNDTIITFSPTFSYLDHVASLNQLNLIKIPRTVDYSIDQGLFEKEKKVCKVVYLCAPNNPTGNAIELEQLEYFLHLKDTIIVLDEAYIEFADQSFTQLVNQYENLIVLRTFSKCFAMAGMRVGYGVMNETIQERLMQIKPPFSVSTVAEFLVSACLKKRTIFDAQIKIIKEQREYLFKELEKINQITVYPSKANFLLMKFDTTIDASLIHTLLKQKGIFVRYYNAEKMQNNLRVSIGQEHENKAFLLALQQIMHKITS